MANKSKPNVTFQRLSNLPFKSASELKKAQEEIKLQIWKQLEQAKALDDLIKREEYGFFSEEFIEGLSCSFENEETNLFRVFSPGKGIKINVNKTIASEDPTNESLIGVLVKSVSESFATTYYKAKGFLPPENIDSDAILKSMNKKSR